MSPNFYHLYSLVFKPATTSFNDLAERNPDGTWRQSYTEHVAAKESARRVASVSSVGVLIVSAMITHYLINWLV